MLLAAGHRRIHGLAGAGVVRGPRARHGHPSRGAYPAHTFVMLGDGEAQEGQVWETVHVAPRYGAGNLTAIVDWNGMQQYGWALRRGRGAPRQPARPVGRHRPPGAFEAFGWRVLEIDGHDFGQILAACEDVRAGTGGAVPTAILAHTVKGRGISFTEGRSEWHARPATPDEAAAARAELALGGRSAVTKPQRDVWAETLVELAATNPDILVMDADLATSTKADRFAAAYPDRFLQMGIAEQGMVGAAAGLSFTGYVPWLSSFGIFFSNRALDQVRMSVAQTHANVKFGAAYTGLPPASPARPTWTSATSPRCARCPA